MTIKIVTYMFILTLVGCVCSNDNQRITIARGANENPEISKMAIEIDDDGAVFIYLDKPQNDTSHYYYGKISIEKFQNIKLLSNKFFGRFSSQINQHVYDSTKLEIGIFDNQKTWNIAGYQHEFTDNQFELLNQIFNISNEIKLTPIQYHKFDTNIQFETTPAPPIPLQKASSGR